MASTTCLSSVLFLLLVATFTAGASAATFTITNNCEYPVWPAATGLPFDISGTQLDQGQTWTVNLNPGNGITGCFWACTDCSVNGDCADELACTLSGKPYNGDCADELACTVAGKPWATLAEFTIFDTANNQDDTFDISRVKAYNLPMAFSCTSTGVELVCTDASCPDAYMYQFDVKNQRQCSHNSNYQVTFCPCP